MSEQPSRRDRRMATRMQRKGRGLFTGRAQETTLFQQTLRALQGLGDDDAELKTAFSVHGQGGAGKTTLLREFEAICQSERVEYIYVDAQLESGESISDLVELMRSIRRHFSQKGFQTALEQNPFADFDESYQRYKALEERVRRQHERRLSAAQDNSGQDDSDAAGDLLGEGVGRARTRGPASLNPRSEREWFVSALGNLEDAEFFQRPEARLVEQFSDALERLWGDGVFVLMLDTYEKLDHVDADIRDTFLAQLNINLVVIFAGRHSLHDRFSLMWRDNTHFLELRPFSLGEVADYLQRRGLDQDRLAGPVHAFTRGWPLAMGLAADAAERAPDLAAALALFTADAGAPEHRLQIIDSVAERLLNQVAEEERAAIWASAALTTFGHNELQAVIGAGPLRQKQFQQLTAYSFIVRAGAGFAVHDLVRDYILRSFKQRHPAEYAALQRRAADYYFAQQRARAADVDAGAWRSAEWRNLTKEYLYHSMQADEPAGVQLLFRHLAEALYERNYQYTQQLAQLIRRTLPITTINLHGLEPCCAAIQAGDVARACALLEEDLARPDIPRPQRYLLAMTLGHLRMQWPFWNYAEALGHFTSARETAQALLATYTPERNGSPAPASPAPAAAAARPLVVMSYTPFDDEYENGSLTRFRAELHRALRFSGGDIEIFQDLDIAPGQNIAERIAHSLSAGVILIPIITPNFLKSAERRRELEMFLERERQLGRNDLIFWVYYHPVEALDAAMAAPEAADLAADSLVRELARRAGISWQPYRGRDFNEPAVKSELEQIARRMIAVVRGLSTTPAPAVSARPAADSAGAHYPTWLALALARQGACQARLSQWAPAIANLQAGLSQAQATGEQQTILRCLLQLGAAYREQQRYDQAIALFEEGLGHDLRAAPAMQLDLLQELGQTYQSQGKHQPACAYLRQACDLARETRQDERLAAAYQLLGEAYRDWGMIDEALDCLRAGLRAAEESRDAAQVAYTLSYMGSACWWRNDHAGAIDYYTQSRERYRALGQATAAAYMSDCIGDNYRAWAKYDQALSHYAEARAGYEAEGEQEKLAGLIGGIGILHQQRGDYERSVEYHRESLRLYEQLEKADNIAGAWLSIGHSYREWARYAQALEHYETARTYYEQIGKNNQVALTEMNIGLTYEAQGNYARAIEYLARARDRYQRLDRPADVAKLWSSQGDTYRLWRKYDQAIAAYEESYRRYEALLQQTSMATQLYNIGRAQLARHTYEQAIRLFERSRGMFAELGDATSEANLWGWLGDTYQAWGKLDEAITHHQEAYRLHQACGNEINASTAMQNIGLAYRDRGNYAQAVDWLTRSLKLIQNLDSPQRAAHRWDHLGDTYRLWGKLDEAIAHYQEALRLNTALGSLANQAINLYGLGLTHQARGSYAEAISYIEQSRQLREQLNEPLQIASLWSALGTTYRLWGKLDQAIAHYQEAAERYRALDSELQVAFQWYSIGQAYEARSDYAQAIDYLNRSRELYEKHESLQNAAWVWYYLGEAYRNWDKYDQALAHLEEARRRHAAHENLPAVAATLGLIGYTYRSQRQYSRAVATFVECRDLYTRLDRPADVANAWRDLGATYSWWLKYDQAITHHAEALRRYEELENLVQAAYTHSNLAWAYARSGRYSEAITHFTRSRELMIELDRPADVAGMTRNMGEAYLEWGRSEEALRHYEEALARYGALGLEAEQADVLRRIGQAHQRAGDYLQAVEYLSQSRVRYEQLGNGEETLNQWSNLAKAYHDWGHHAEALRCHEQALALAAESGLAGSAAYDEAGMAYTLASDKQYDAARAWLDRSQATYDKLGRVENVAYVWNRRGNVELDCEELDQARSCFAQALAMSQEHEYIRPEANAERGLGECAERAGDLDQAREHYQRALELFARIDHPDDRAKAEVGLGRLACRQGDLAGGRAIIDAALATLAERSYLRERAEQAMRAGRFFIEIGRPAAARDYLELARQAFAQLDNQPELAAVATLLDGIAGQA